MFLFKYYLPETASLYENYNSGDEDSNLNFKKNNIFDVVRIFELALFNDLMDGHYGGYTNRGKTFMGTTAIGKT